MRLFIRLINHNVTKLQFFPPSIGMSKKSINVDNKKINKSNFYKDGCIEVNKILFSKKEPYNTKMSIKYFSGFMIMMLLYNYV